LQERLAARGRDGDRDARLARSAQFADLSADVIISNTGPLTEVVRLFQEAIYRNPPSSRIGEQLAESAR
jgi:ribose 1,5-bisphosphokinase PhnN